MCEPITNTVTEWGKRERKAQKGEEKRNKKKEKKEKEWERIGERKKERQDKGRGNKQTSLFHIPAHTQHLELIWSRACGKCAELAFWKFVGV